jgi:hypothetical protein
MHFCGIAGTEANRKALSVFRYKDWEAKRFSIMSQIVLAVPFFSWLVTHAHRQVGGLSTRYSDLLLLDFTVEKKNYILASFRGRDK